MKKGHDSDAEYTVSQLTRLLNISRTTLLYYESVGLVSPLRKEGSGYRVYRNKDILCLINAHILHNAGLSIGEIVKIRENKDSLAEDNIALYCDRLTDKIEYLEAVKRVLMEYHDKRAMLDDQFSIVYTPRYYYVLSGNEEGWDRYCKTNTADILFQHMPLAGLGAITRESVLKCRYVDSKWGRFIAEENLRFIDIDKDEFETVGGCMCLAIRVKVDTSLEVEMEEDFQKEALKFLADRNFSYRGTTFIPYILPNESSVFEFHQPIVPLTT